jgi:hypothetical protein
MMVSCKLQSSQPQSSSLQPPDWLAVSLPQTSRACLLPITLVDLLFLLPPSAPTSIPHPLQLSSVSLFPIPSIDILSSQTTSSPSSFLPIRYLLHSRRTVTDGTCCGGQRCVICDNPQYINSLQLILPHLSRCHFTLFLQHTPLFTGFQQTSFLLIQTFARPFERKGTR